MHSGRPHALTRTLLKLQMLDGCNLLTTPGIVGMVQLDCAFSCIFRRCPAATAAWLSGELVSVEAV